MGADDAALISSVRAAQAGDETAFLNVFRAVQPRLLRYVMTLVGEAAAEDVADAAWRQIGSDLPSFRGDGHQFRGWSARIARSCALSHVAERSRRSGAGVAAGDPAAEAPETPAASHGLALLARLPADRAEVLALRVIMGLDDRLTAQVLGMRRRAVRTASHRGLRQLAQLLDAASDDDPAPADATGDALCAAVQMLKGV